MKIAILLTGQPRHLEQGAWWFKNKVFPDHKNKQIDVDYYCYFWDDGSPNLSKRIADIYNPIRSHVQQYDPVIDEFITRTREYNDTADNWEAVPDKFRYEHLFDSDVQSNYIRNIWGQYLCSGKITKMVGNLENEYDIVIKTRSDAAFFPMAEKYWIAAFENIYNNPVFDDKLFSPWLYIDQGIPYFADFAFISKPQVWYNFSKNIEEHCFNLAGPNKQLWYELGVTQFEHHPHWIWNKLCGYSKTSMLSFSTVWPMPFDASLIRYNYDITKMTFTDIKSEFDRYDVENPFKS